MEDERLAPKEVSSVANASVLTSQIGRRSIGRGAERAAKLHGFLAVSANLKPKPNTTRIQSYCLQVGHNFVKQCAKITCEILSKQTNTKSPLAWVALPASAFELGR